MCRVDFAGEDVAAPARSQDEDSGICGWMRAWMGGLGVGCLGRCEAYFRRRDWVCCWEGTCREWLGFVSCVERVASRLKGGFRNDAEISPSTSPYPG